MKYFLRNLHTRVWQRLIGLYKLEPQGRIAAATFFPAVQYLSNIRVGLYVQSYIFLFSECNISQALASACMYIFLFCVTFPPFAPVHISTNLSTISPTFVHGSAELLFTELEKLKIWNSYLPPHFLLRRSYENSHLSEKYSFMFSF